MSNHDDGLFIESSPVSSFQPHPEKIVQAVICDVRSLGLIAVQYKGEDKGEKPHISISFQSKERIKTDDPENKFNGQPYVINKRYLASLSDNARLRKDIESILCRKMTTEELKPKGFDLNSLIGKNCQITVNHSEPKDGKIYANINSVAGWNEDFGANLEVDPNYVRYKDRPSTAGDSDDKEIEDAIKELKTAVNIAATYGIKPKSEIDYANLSLGQAKDLTKTFRERVEKKRAEKGTPNPLDDVFDDDDEPVEQAEKPSAQAKQEEKDWDGDYDKAVEEEKVEAKKKKAGNLSDAVRNKKEESVASSKEEDVSVFNSAVEDENDRIVAAGRKPMSDNMIIVFDTARKKNLDVHELMDNEEALAAINARLVELKKPAFKSMDDLSAKSAACALVMREIDEGRIEWF